MTKKFALIGNPNCGKSTIFNYLTGAQQKTSNWAGVTVCRQDGTIKKTTAQIIDLPGVYSLGLGSKKSTDQRIALNFLSEESFDCLINVINSIHLETNLYLTLQLLELQIPIILILNMKDLAFNKNLTIMSNILAKKLECHVLQLNGTDYKSLETLRSLIIAYKYVPYRNNIFTLYPERLQEIYRAIQLTKNNTTPSETVHLLSQSHLNLSGKDGDKNTDLRLVNARYEVIDNLVKQASKNPKKGLESNTDKIDKLCLHETFGIPLFLLILYTLFTLSVKFGNVFGPAVGMFCEATFVDVPVFLVSKVPCIEPISFVLQSLGSSIGTTASFIPITLAIYFFLSLLEMSGYMARAAIITNKFTSFFGLATNSLFPIIAGMGCNVSAILAARIVNDKIQRIITIMVSPFLSCSARLSVYTLCCSIFFPQNAERVILLLYVLGFSLVLFTGFIMHNKKRVAIETHITLPDYHMPKFTSVFFSSLSRTKLFILGTGKTIIIVFFIINLLSQIKYSPLDTGVLQEKHHFIKHVGHLTIPIFKPMGFREESWPAAISIITGFLAKEVVIGTLLSLEGIDQDQDPSTSLLTIMGKYQKSMKIITTGKTPYTTLDIDSTKLKNIRKIFPSSGGALSYLIFIALYLPCASVFITMGREVGYKWAMISAIWTTASAYIIAVISFQIFSFINHHTVQYTTLAIMAGTYFFLSVSLRFISHKHYEQLVN